MVPGRAGGGSFRGKITGLSSVGVLMVASCAGGGDVMCCDVMWYDAMCLVPRGREDRQCAWLQDVMLCDVMLCDVM